MSSISFRRLLLALLLFSLPVRSATAQTLTSATVVGTVTDPGGAIVPGATVSIKQPETDAVTKTTTDSSGQYRFPFLKPGEYEVTADATGLATTTSRFQLKVGQEQAVNLTL